jgi:filamentous hemagglutinin family protein
MSYQKILLWSFFVNFLISVPTHAQIVPDQTLGKENSVVATNVLVKGALADLIEGGVIRDNNLFHSFEQFNIADGSRVYFANPAGIINILTRVTGNNISNIFGMLGVDGTANLFLLNPNGIVFGENASLDVNGSFLATTADSYIFNNGFEYSASNPETPPLLTINMPLGLQFGEKAETIEIQGRGHNLSFNPFTFNPIRIFRPHGLEVKTANTLGLLGGAINLSGANLTASKGRIELGSVAENSHVLLMAEENGFSFDYQEVSNFNNINLTNSSSIDVSGSGSGDVQLRGNNIDLLDTSAIIANTLGADHGGEIQLKTTKALRIIGIDQGLFPSAIFSQVELNATGSGSNLRIDGETIEIKNNGLISSAISGAGNGGNIDINAKEAIFAGSDKASFYFTGIFSQVSPIITAIGKSSNLNIEVQNLTITKGAIIATATLSEGDSGDIFVKADSLEIAGTGISLLFAQEPTPSGIFTTVTLPSIQGAGGNISIETESLKIADGGQIRAGTFGFGDSGNISIQAQEIVISDTANLLEIPVASGIFSSSGLGILTGNIEQTTGNGGDITINTTSLELNTGGQIGTGTSSSGNSGNLSINAQNIKILGHVFDNNNEALTGFANTSGLFTSVVRSDAIGSGGDILVETEHLQILNGGAIAANVFGKGKGGNIQIKSQSVDLSDSFMVAGVRSGITTTVEATGTGNAGNIGIVANNLNLMNGGSIAASAMGRGNAGDINLYVTNLDINGVSPEAQLKSQITAFSEGDFAAGTINILADKVAIRDRAIISVNNLGKGDSGNLNLKTQELVLAQGASLEAQVNVGSQGNINLMTDNIVLTDESKITSQATGTATGGNIQIENQDNLVLLGNSQIIADAIEGDGGNIKITTQGLFVSLDSFISASSQFGLDGTVKINTPNNQTQQFIEKSDYDFISLKELISNRCFGSQLPHHSSFTYVGRGGVPVNPETRIDEDYSLAEFALNSNLQQSPVEANAIAYNSQGKVVLVNRLTPSIINSWEVNLLNGCQEN